MAEQSVGPQHSTALISVPWQDDSDSGTYGEAGSGDRYHIPQEALIAGGSPIIGNES
jgi:hypothetical protein